MDSIQAAKVEKIIKYSLIHCWKERGTFKMRVRLIDHKMHILLNDIFEGPPIHPLHTLILSLDLRLQQDTNWSYQLIIKQSQILFYKLQSTDEPDKGNSNFFLTEAELKVLVTKNFEKFFLDAYMQLKKSIKHPSIEDNAVKIYPSKTRSREELLLKLLCRQSLATLRQMPHLIKLCNPLMLPYLIAKKITMKLLEAN